MKLVLFAALFLLAKASSLQFNATAPRNGEEIEHMVPSRNISLNGVNIGKRISQVAITVDRDLENLACGGVFLSERFVLTAARCTQGPASRYEVMILIVDSSVSMSLFRKVRRIHNHPYYDSSSSRNDISLLELTDPFGFDDDDFMQPAYLPDSDDSYADAICYITGWGRPSGFWTTIDRHIEAEVHVITSSDCSRRMGSVPGVLVHSSNICASGRYVDKCMGDGGGPLFCKRCSLDEYVVVGVSSWGVESSGTCLSLSTSVYTRTRSHISWLRSIVGSGLRFPDRSDTGWCPGGGGSGSTNKPTPSGASRLCFSAAVIILLWLSSLA